MATKKRLIDANALIRKSIEVQAPRTGLTLLLGQQWMDTVHAVRVTAIMSAPTVDAVEVVRCKDCKWIEKGKDYEPYCNHWKSGLYANVKDNDFCSYGERKDNG